MRADVKLIGAMEAAFQQASRQLVFVHSNIQNGFAIERPQPFSRDAFLATHFRAIDYVTGSSRLWFPAFHYDYCQTRTFDLTNDPSQVGHLSEFVRCHVATWRTPVPVFSIVGTGEMPSLSDQHVIDPFGKGSVFDQLVEQDGLIFNYGCRLDTLTFVHYCESMANDLPYRYRKRFDGQVIDPVQGIRSVSFGFHVRPLGREMSYDWPRLLNGLVEQGLIQQLGPDARDFQLIAAKPLAEYWLEKINQDPLFLLSLETKAWVDPMLTRLGRGFVLEDFEPAEVTHHG